MKSILARLRAFVCAWYRAISPKRTKDYADKQIKTKRTVRAATFALVVLIVSGCCSIPPEYHAADSATYDAVAADWLRYVESDPTRADAMRILARELVRSWKARIDEWKP